MKKSTLFLTGMAALLLSFGLILTGCSTDSDDPSGGGDKKADLAGTWVKEGGADPYPEQMKYEGRGGSNDPLYFISSGSMGGTAWSGQMMSYDGTTAKVGNDKNYYDPHAISFTAKIAGNKLTISDLSDELASFNGTYTKEGSGSDDPAGGDPTTPGNGGYTGEGVTPTGFESDVNDNQISTYTTGGFLDDIDSDDSTKKGFTVTVNGTLQTIKYVFVQGSQLNIDIEDYKFSTGDTVLISYNGTGYFAGKLKMFADIPVTLGNYGSY
jgi:hypothetical protein